TGFAQAIFTLSPAGMHTITASYGGDANYSPSTSAPVIQTMNPGRTQLAFFPSSVNPSVVGQQIDITAVVQIGQGGNPFVPTGTVQFLVDGSNFGAPVAVVSQEADLITAALTAGIHTISATYSGDTNFAASSGTVDAADRDRRRRHH